MMTCMVSSKPKKGTRPVFKFFGTSMIYCIFRGGLAAVKCGRKSDYGRSSVPTRIRECDGAFERTGVNSATKEIRHSRIAAQHTTILYIYRG